MLIGTPRYRIFTLLLMLSPIAWAAQGQTAPAQTAGGQTAAAALLPTDFAGWQIDGKLQQSASAASADAANADVLAEDGFTRFAAASYTRNGSKLTLRALRFADATGAYSAYTFYRRPGMRIEDVGTGAANDGSRILFWQGSTVVDATFDHLSAMSAAELRELATSIPEPSGSAGIAPPLPRYLPVKTAEPLSLQALSTHYALGPAGYARSGGVLPVGLVGFDRGAEVLTAAYSGDRGDGTLTLINYPTPQMAAERQRAIAAFLKAGNSPQAGWPPPLAASSPAALLCRRSGPLLAVTSGSFSEVDAHNLIGQVNYLAEVTWNDPKGYTSDVTRTARLLVNIVVFSCIVCGAALLLALFLGGGRALVRRLRGKPVSGVDEVEFISLRLDK